jgi:nucleotide-binding universal stress UspA family protein
MRLLLAVDVNEGAEDLVHEGIMWAGRLSARLDLLYVDEHAYNTYLVQDPSVRTVLDREWTRIREQQHDKLRKLMETVPEPMRGDAAVLTGRASDEIVEAAKTRDALLIATHGRKGLSHALLGSVAERVVRLATVPVIVIRRRA